MGGLPAGKVEPTEHDYEEWERRVDALMMLLSGVKGAKKLMTVDELRKNIEALPPDAYDRMSYYERWITSIFDLFEENVRYFPTLLADPGRRHVLMDISPRILAHARSRLSRDPVGPLRKDVF
jgi:hypothetical protein